MRRWILAMCFVAVNACWQLPARGSSEHPPARSCTPHGARVIVADARAEVYSVVNEVSACLREGPRSRFRLGLTEDSSTPEANCVAGDCTVTQVALAGDAVAYATPRGYSPRIIARDVAGGRVLHEALVQVVRSERVLVEQAVVLRLVVGPTGAIAWIQEDLFATHGGNPGPPTDYGVFGLGSDGSHAFALHLPVAPRSLRLRGDHLSWSERGRPHSASLP